MLINTVPDDCIMYIGFNLFSTFNITSIINVFILSTEKKVRFREKRTSTLFLAAAKNCVISYSINIISFTEMLAERNK